MSVPRKWLVSLEVPQGASSDSIGNVLSELEKRVEGEIALVGVPSQALAEVFQDASGIDRFSLHLIAPYEKDRSQDGGFRSLWGVAASVNVQPGRGQGAEDFEDCGVWLRSVVDFRLVADGEEVKILSRREPADAQSVEWQPPSESGAIPDDSGMSEFLGEVLGKHSSEDTLEAIKGSASKRAGGQANRFRRLAILALLLGIAPGLVLGIGAAGQWPPLAVSTINLLVALLAMTVAFSLWSLKLKTRWVHARSLAEICRSILASGRILDPLFPPAARYFPDQPILARSLALKWAESDPGPRGRSPSDIGTAYVKDRLDDPDHGQIPYYQNHAASARKRKRELQMLFYSCTALNVLCTILALLFLTGMIPDAGAPELTEFNERWVAGLLSSLLPALAAAALGVLGISDTSRRAASYQSMANRLKRSRAELLQLSSEASITEAVRETERMLLEEVSDWEQRHLF